MTATLSANPAVGSPTVVLKSGSVEVAGITVFDAATHIVTFTPAAPLAWSTTYMATVTVDGATPTGGSWSFTTAAEPPTVTATSIFAANAVPDTPSWNDALAVQVGVRFQASVAGTVTGIRFYKGAANTGSHTGYLWSASGQQLAAVTFSTETASGWQTATFSQPVAILPGTEYRASYQSTVGRYSVTLNALAAPVTSGALSTPASGAVYRYGTAFPDQLSVHNYWIDVFFVPSP